MQDKEYRAKYAADRVRTVSMVWLGSTLGCAECHDHKYDPFTAKDFYSLAAYFADVDEFGFYPSGFDRGDWGPALDLPTASQRTQLERLDAEIASLDKAMKLVKGNTESYVQHLSELQAKGKNDWKNLVPLSASSSEGAVLTISADGLVSASGPNPDTDSHTLVFKPGAGSWTTIKLTNEVDEALPGNRVSRGWKSFVIAEFEVQVSDAEQKLAPVELASVQVDKDSDRYPGEAAIDGRVETGWACEHGHSGRHTLAVTFASPLATDEDTYLTVRIVQRSDRRHATLGKYRISMTELAGATIAPQNPLLQAASKPADERSDEEKKLLEEAAQRVAQIQHSATKHRTVLVAQRRTLNGTIPRVLYTKRTESPRIVRLLPRGNWMDDTGEIVKGAPPGFLLRGSKSELSINGSS